MDQLEQARQAIDRVDSLMAELFEERMEAVAQVIRYKREQGLPILDAAREKAVVEKNTARLKNPELKPYFADLLKTQMELSRQYQAAVLGRDTAAYQGVEGAFSHIALMRLFPRARARAYATWREVFEAVAQGHAAHGVLPFENSSAGDVLDLCYAYPGLYVVNVYDLPVSQNLLALPDINTETTNTTRFIVIGREQPNEGNRFSLLFTVDNRPGALARIIHIIGEAGFNMECIKSRPRPGHPFEYYFYTELEGSPNGEPAARLMEQLEAACPQVRLLGVYTR